MTEKLKVLGKSLDFLLFLCPGIINVLPGRKSNFPHYNYITGLVKCQVFFYFFYFTTLKR